MRLLNPKYTNTELTKYATSHDFCKVDRYVNIFQRKRDILHSCPRTFIHINFQSLAQIFTTNLTVLVLYISFPFNTVFVLRKYLEMCELIN